MLKLMNALLILVILCEGIQSIDGEALQCIFGNKYYFGALGSLYSCSVTALENPNDNKIITENSGNHQSNKYERDVKQLYISEKDTYFIPEGLGSVFNITALIIRESKLKEIRSKDFYGMQNLEYLSLWGNQIKYIGSAAFDQLKNLNTVVLYGNICVNKDYYGATAITQMKRDLKLKCVEPISTSITTQNPLENELSAAMKLHQRNEIELIKLRDDLKKEQSENLKVKNERNAWIKEKDALMMKLNNKTSEINELKTNCKHSNEGEGAVEMKFNEIMNHLLKVSQEHQMECEDIIKLRAQLATAKNQLKIAQDEKDQLEKKLTDLKKEFTEAKETIDQKLPKMEQLIEDFYMEVMDLKIERHNERQNSIALRSKLMEAKEQLAECQINERISC